MGFDVYKRAVLQDPVPALRSLPYIGRITAFHLAKNLGADLAKPDRNLSELAAAEGFHDAHALCLAIAQATGDPRKVADLVLWRHLEQGHRFDESVYSGSNDSRKGFEEGRMYDSS